MLSGCSLLEKVRNDAGPTPTVTEVPGSFDMQEKSANGFLFIYNNSTISMDMDAALVLEELGKAQSCFRADSCVINEVIRTYSYGSFELDTYEKDGKEYISCIFFKDDTISTAEGAYLFMPKEELFELYGENYTVEAGMLIYRKDDMKLKFILTDNLVTAIQYSSLVTEVKQ